METYHYNYQLEQQIPVHEMVSVGVAGSGNLEIVITNNANPLQTELMITTNITGYKAMWDAVINAFIETNPIAGLTYVVRDAGAAPAVASLRLRQALETYKSGYRKKENYLESDARERIYSLVDEGSFSEFLLDDAVESPNLPALNMQTALDDGVVIGKATLNNKKQSIAIAAQQKDFIGGSVGEVHGAKINGLIHYAIKHRLDALVLLIDSGGVRLQEANSGEIAISEIIRSLLKARAAGIKTIGVVCGSNGAFGGMGIIAGSLDYLIVNQVGRIGVSGAEVIEAVRGAEVFDARNRPLVWRVYGGRTRYLQNAAAGYTTHQTSDIRHAINDALSCLDANKLFDLAAVREAHQLLKQRINNAKECSDEGEWLQKNRPDLFALNIFNINDQQFLEATNRDQ